MSRNRIIPMLAVLMLLVSCTEKEVRDWSWVDGLGKDYPVELEAFNSKWNLCMTNVIDEENYLFNGSSQLFTNYEAETDITEVLAVADYLEKEIFPLFPEDMIVRRMPNLIYVASDVTMEYSDEVYDAEKVAGKDEWKQIHTIVDRVRSLPGDIAVNHLTLSAKALHENPDLKFEWTSLIMERMLANTNVWPQDAEFIDFSERRYREMESLNIYKYYQNVISDGKDYFRCYASDKPGTWCQWFFCGSVRGSRCFYSGKCLFTEDYMREFGGGQEEDRLQFWYFLTYRQDFANLLAFMLVRSPEEREALLSEVDGMTIIDTQKGILTISRTVIEDKMQMVRQYMKEHYNWNIK